ncbi:hypothetical protein J5N97_002252 [Dioscorea zingiberensis]|uniref:Uncharacterized protein n=1 Tax=Dioscorea zingiberensis TaxID=325984 RepID=A0A9D5HPE8_9LILI|nr:hypothetical protein J5N97_002252 [Dioscorea zingiberensis]
MAASSKFDLPSDSPDGSTYMNGQRGSYGAALLERVGSFREGTENRVSSLLPSVSRSASTISQGGTNNLVQSLLSDLKPVVLEPRLPRAGGLKRGISSILGVSPEDSVLASVSTKPLPSSSVEELKRMKGNLNEGFVKARERAKAFNDAVCRIDKYHHTRSKKRSRAAISSNGRSNALFPGASMVKVGPQSHISTTTGPQKIEEKVKAAVPNRRVRTSIVDARMDTRANGIARPSGIPDTDKEMFKLVNGGLAPSEDKSQALTSEVDGSEKPRLKKRRSLIKSDVSGSAVMTRSLDSDRETKRVIQPKLGTDVRPRLSNTHGFRSGPVSGSIRVGKADITSQQNNLGVRPSPKSDQDNSSLPNDRRDRLIGLEKEGAILKAGNKQNGSEENPAGGLLTRLNTSVRAPRSNSGSLSRASPNPHRVLANPDDWENSQFANKVNGFGGTINRKCSSSQSASLPIPQSFGQRPQKMSRVARRSNLPLVSNHDELTISDTIENSSINEDGLGVVRHLSSNTSLVKLKVDRISQATLLENEDSGVIETKPKDKIRKCNEIEEKTTQSLQKTASLILPPRKNKVTIEDDIGDGVRRQGRVGRGCAPASSVLPATFEKLDNNSTLKQTRSARIGSEKIESKQGRPVFKKSSERKCHTRVKHSVNNACLDSAGESDDDHEELLAAANAALNTRHACTGSFWKQFEPIFGLLSAEDIAYLTQQIHLVDDETSASRPSIYVGNNGQSLKDDCGYVSQPSQPALGCLDDFVPISNGTIFTSCEKYIKVTSQIKQDEPLLEQLVSGNGSPRGISMCQALLSAIIEEEEVENFYHATSTADEYSYADAYRDRLEVRSCTFYDELPHDKFECSNGLPESNTGPRSRLGNSLDDIFPEHPMAPGVACTEFHYNQMSISDRILLELSEIGLHPEPMPDLALTEEDIDDDINKLQEMLHMQVLKKKSLLLNLEKVVMEAKEGQERKLVHIALDKLVELAYDKYMACFGPNASSGKHVNKNTKLAAMALVKRTLARCEKFEKTGISCFNKPAFRDIFLSISSHNAETESMDAALDGEAAKRLASTQNLERATDLSISLESQPAERLNMHDKVSNTPQPINQLSEYGKDEVWLNGAKRREVLLEDVVGNSSNSFRSSAGLESSLARGTKGKRSGRDRGGKGSNKDTTSRNGTLKARPSLSNVKGERKNKAKLKQKTTQLSASHNGLVSSSTERPDTMLSSSGPKSHGKLDENVLLLDSVGRQKTSDEIEATELNNLQIPELDVDDFGGQGQDIGSWFSIVDDEALQDIDCMGLEIPMDDLSEVNMMI